jgi:L-2-hydroxyglutarate oxidase
MLSMKEAREIDPLVTGFGDMAIWSPTTSIASNMGLIQSIKDELSHESNYANVDIAYNTGTQEYIKTNHDTMKVNTELERDYETKYLVNAAGVSALSIAQQLGFGLSYKSLPVKGNYLVSETPMPEIKTLVYPVPMGKNFLGVHSTITPDGYVKIGPSVSPAFSAENYIGFENLRRSEML